MLGGCCLVALTGVAVDSKGVLPQYTMNFRLGPLADVRLTEILGVEVSGIAPVILERFEVMAEHRLTPPVIRGNSCALFRFKRCSDARKTQRVHAHLNEFWRRVRRQVHELLLEIREALRVLAH